LLGKPSLALLVACVVLHVVLNEVNCNPVPNLEPSSGLLFLKTSVNQGSSNWRVKRQADCDTDNDGDCDENDETGGNYGSDDDDDDDDGDGGSQFYSGGGGGILKPNKCVYCASRLVYFFVFNIKSSNLTQKLVRRLLFRIIVFY